MNTTVKKLILLPILLISAVSLGFGFQYSNTESDLIETLIPTNNTSTSENGESPTVTQTLNQTNKTTFASQNRTLALIGEPVTTILARIVTHDIDNAGTDAHVYLGIGGREFYIDSDNEVGGTDYDDFERGDDRTYFLGEGGFVDTHRVLQPEHNDPRSPYALDFALLDKFPVYIRTEPNEFANAPDWALKSVDVQAYGPTEFRNYWAPQNEDDYFGLGQYIGEAVYLLGNENQTLTQNSSR
jgi:hypothetical protein